MLDDRNGETITRNLLGFVALSLFLHALPILLIGGNKPGVRHGLPLQVEFRREDIVATAARLETNEHTGERRAKLTTDKPATPPRIAQPSGAPRAAVSPVAPTPLYLPDDAVDIWAEPENDAPLIYPYIAYLQKLSGRVRFELFINESGLLDRVQIIEASPEGVFEKAAIDAVTRLKFHPAQKYGRPVKSRKTIEVVFDPDDPASRSGQIAPEAWAAEK